MTIDSMLVFLTMKTIIDSTLRIKKDFKKTRFLVSMSEEYSLRSIMKKLISKKER